MSTLSMFACAMAVLQLVQIEVVGLFVVFSQGKPHLAILIRPQ
jgi:hypothetical protein